MKNKYLLNFYLIKRLAVIFLGCLFCNSATAQNFTASLTGNPLTTTGWTIATGTSYVSGNAFVITNPIGGQAGYVYYDTPVNLTNCAQFTVSFEFQIIPAPGGSLADGIAFWYIANPPTAFLSGGGIGLPANPNGLILVLDTYDNDGNGNNPLETLLGYNGSFSQYNEGATAGVLGAVVPNQFFLADGAWHTCTETYNAGAVNVYFNGSATASITGTYPMNQTGYFGFSASTGAAYSTQSIRNVTITGFIPPKPPIVTPVLNYCQGDNAPALTAVGQNLLWYTTDTGSTPLPGAPVPNTSTPGSTTWYVSQAFTPGGCESHRDSIKVNVTLFTAVGYNNIDTTICSSELFQFKGLYSGDTTQQYIWETSSDLGGTWNQLPVSHDSTFNQIVFLPGDYWVRYLTYADTITNSSFCEKASAISKIRRNPDIKVSDMVTEIDCFGAKDGVLNINILSGQQPLTFSMQPGGASNQTGNFTDLDTGTYIVQITDADNKCQDSIEDVVVVQPTPLTIRDTIIKIEPTCLKDANGSINVLALGGTVPYIYELDSVSQYSIDGTFTGLFAGNYILNVKDKNNCRVSEPIELTAQTCCKVFLPSAFTPNNDGKNDRYKAASNSAIHSLDLHVFNRYGQEVYHSISTEDNGWDGTYNNEPAEIGTYFYMASYFCEDVNREITQKGTVTLIR